MQWWFLAIVACSRLVTRVCISYNFICIFCIYPCRPVYFYDFFYCIVTYMSICIQYSSPQYRMIHAARIHILVARSVPWHSCTTPSTNRWNHRQVRPNFPDAESMWPLEGTLTWKTWWHRLIQVWKHFSLSPLRVSIAWSLCRFQWWTECWADAWALRTCWTNIEQCWRSEWEFWGHTTTAKRFYCRSHFRGFAACT